MAIYKISDLHNHICEIASDGYKYVDITLDAADEDFPEALHFDAIEDSESSVDCEEVESCKLPENHYYTDRYPINGSDYCAEINFTYNEISSILHALDNALQYSKECLKDPSNSRDITEDIKTTSIEWRNLQAKLLKALKHLI